MPLRFADKPSLRPRNYLLRKEQWRLLVMVGALGLVILAIQRVRQPAFVAKLEQVFGGEPDAQPLVEPVPRVEMSPAQPLPPLERSHFAAIRDNAPFRDSESEAWFFTFGVLKGAPPASAATEVTYAQLTSQPDVYRGKPVHVRGLVRRVEQIKPAHNELGIEQLYRVILQPAGGEVWPITLYTLRPPVGAALGEDIRLAAEATGYFFKKQSYSWAGGLGTTPVILAKSIDMARPASPSPTSSTRDVNFLTVIVWAALLSGVALSWFLLRTSTGETKRTQSASEPISISIREPEA